MLIDNPGPNVRKLHPRRSKNHRVRQGTWCRSRRVARTNGRTGLLRVQTETYRKGPNDLALLAAKTGRNQISRLLVLILGLSLALGAVSISFADDNQKGPAKANPTKAHPLPPKKKKKAPNPNRPLVKEAPGVGVSGGGGGVGKVTKNPKVQ